MKHNQIPMTPDKSVMWDVQRIDSLSSVLYVSPACTPELTQKVIELSQDPPPLESPCSKGTQGRIYRSGQYAIKVYRRGRTSDRDEGLSALRANVALEAGLRTLGNLETGEGRKSRSYNYSAPNIYAALIPDDDIESDRRVVWGMDFVEGTLATQSEVPDYEERRNHFETAVCHVGFSKGRIAYDDGFWQDGILPNTIKTPTPEVSGPRILSRFRTNQNPVDLVKIDVQALIPFDF